MDNYGHPDRLHLLNMDGLEWMSRFWPRSLPRPWRPMATYPSNLAAVPLRKIHLSRPTKPVNPFEFFYSCDEHPSTQTIDIFDVYTLAVHKPKMLSHWRIWVGLCGLLIWPWCPGPFWWRQGQSVLAVSYLRSRHYVLVYDWNRIILNHTIYTL